MMVMSSFQHLFLFQRLVVSEAVQFDLKREKKDDQTGYYLSASNKCSIKRWRAKEFEGRQRLAKGLWKAKPSAPFSVTMQATDDKAKMASADRGCSSAPLFHGPQVGWEGGGMHVWVCVLYECEWEWLPRKVGINLSDFNCAISLLVTSQPVIWHVQWETWCGTIRKQ